MTHSTVVSRPRSASGAKKPHQTNTLARTPCGNVSNELLLDPRRTFNSTARRPNRRVYSGTRRTKIENASHNHLTRAVSCAVFARPRQISPNLPLRLGPSRSHFLISLQTCSPMPFGVRAAILLIQKIGRRLCCCCCWRRRRRRSCRRWCPSGRRTPCPLRCHRFSFAKVPISSG